MNKAYEPISGAAVKSEEQAFQLLEKLFKVADPHVVFGEPLEIGNRLVFTASEVSMGLGVGYGFGEGPVQSRIDESDASVDEREEFSQTGKGVGGGGGGGASGRPIAVISVSEEEGIQVEPVIDTTKVALAFFTTLGSMFFMLSRMKKTS